MTFVATPKPPPSPPSSALRLYTAALDGDMKGRDGSRARPSHSVMPQREGTHPDGWERDREALWGEMGWMDGTDPNHPEPVAISFFSPISSLDCHPLMREPQGKTVILKMDWSEIFVANFRSLIYHIFCTPGNLTCLILKKIIIFLQYPLFVNISCVQMTGIKAPFAVICWIKQLYCCFDQ